MSYGVVNPVLVLLRFFLSRLEIGSGEFALRSFQLGAWVNGIFPAKKTALHVPMAAVFNT